MERGTMEHLNITFPSELKERLDREALREKTKRSTLIQKAVKVYLALKEQQAKNILLREGYEAMALESKNIMDDFKELDRESLKYVD